MRTSTSLSSTDLLCTYSYFFSLHTTTIIYVAHVCGVARQRVGGLFPHVKKESIAGHNWLGFQLLTLRTQSPKNVYNRGKFSSQKSHIKERYIIPFRAPSGDQRTRKFSSNLNKRKFSLLLWTLGDPLPCPTRLSWWSEKAHGKTLLEG